MINKKDDIINYSQKLSKNREYAFSLLKENSEDFHKANENIIVKTIKS